MFCCLRSEESHSTPDRDTLEKHRHTHPILAPCFAKVCPRLGWKLTHLYGIHLPIASLDSLTEVSGSGVVEALPNHSYLAYVQNLQFSFPYWGRATCTHFRSATPWQRHPFKNVQCSRPMLRGRSPPWLTSKRVRDQKGHTKPRLTRTLPKSSRSEGSTGGEAKQGQFVILHFPLFAVFGGPKIARRWAKQHEKCHCHAPVCVPKS